MNTEKPPALIKTTEVMKRLSISRTTLWRRVKENTFPQPRKICGSSRWLESDIDQYISQSTNQTTTA
jgi:prophage regulatory protein